MTNHLWQSTLFAIVAGLLTVALRKNRAQVRYWLWLSASLKFFVPFAVLMSLGSQLDWAPTAKTVASPAVTFAIEQIAQPFPEALPFAPSTTDWTPTLFLGVWLCGVAAIVLIRFRGWLRIRAAVRASTAMDIPVPVEVRSSPGLLEPGVVGLFRPILLLPAGIEKHITPLQLDAVLAHELCHVRRRDNLTSAIHMVVEAIFWFHPLVWWISARLVEERERACDEEVLRLGGDPRIYAEGILNVCKLYVESPLVCVSGVTGSDLKKRIEAIMINRSVLNLNFTRKAALAGAAIVALALPFVMGILHAQSQPQKFEVAAIKRCRELDGRNAKGGPVSFTPRRFNLSCQSVASLISLAYILGGASNLSSPVKVDGGPDWINSERYDINAAAENDASPAVMRGPMLQALLEDRFKLKVHRETREVPVFELTVAKSGPKMQRHVEGSCVARPALDLTKGPPVSPPALPPGQKYCAFGGRYEGSNLVVDAQGITLAEYARVFLGTIEGRPVIDKTGLTGKFDFHVEHAPAEEMRRVLAANGDDHGEPTAPSLLTALQEQLGLKLEAAKGAGEFLIIDSVERPSEN